MRRTLMLSAAAALLLGAAPALAASAPAAEAQLSRVGPPNAKRAWTAEILHPVAARARPHARARVVARLAGETQYSRSHQVLLVTGRRGGWLRVALPKRPNGSRGWVPLSAVELRRTPYRIVVRLASRSLEIVRSGRVVKRYRASVGAPRTPTPTGLYAVADPIPSDGPLGPWVLVLTAYSEVLTDFLGGDGVTAIHGWRDVASLGGTTSNGCIRVSPAAAQRIAAVSGSGTPVQILER